MQQTEFQEESMRRSEKQFPSEQVHDKKRRGNVSKNGNQTNYRYEKLTA